MRRLISLPQPPYAASRDSLRKLHNAKMAMIVGAEIILREQLERLNKLVRPAIIKGIATVLENRGLSMNKTAGIQRRQKQAEQSANSLA